MDFEDVKRLNIYSTAYEESLAEEEIKEMHERREIPVFPLGNMRILRFATPTQSARIALCYKGLRYAREILNKPWSLRKVKPCSI